MSYPKFLDFLDISFTKEIVNLLFYNYQFLKKLQTDITKQVFNDFLNKTT